MADDEEGIYGAVRRSMTEEPVYGWIHDEEALAYGQGLFFTFPVILAGTLETESVSQLDQHRKDLALRSAVKVVMEMCRGKARPGVPASIFRFCTGEVTVANMPVSLGISAEAVVTLPIHMKDTTLFDHPMNVISLAGSGADEYINCIAYVARDDRGSRKFFVYDCSQRYSDEVYDTFGQAFVVVEKLLGGSSAERHKRPKAAAKNALASVDPRSLAPLRTREAVIPEEAEPTAGGDTYMSLGNQDGYERLADYMVALDVSETGGTLKKKTGYDRLWAQTGGAYNTTSGTTSEAARNPYVEIESTRVQDGGGGDYVSFTQSSAHPSSAPAVNPSAIYEIVDMRELVATLNHSTDVHMEQKMSTLLKARKSLRKLEKDESPYTKVYAEQSVIPPVNLAMAEVVKHQRPTWMYLSQEQGSSLPKRKISLRELLSADGTK